MITKQHTALFVMALYDKTRNNGVSQEFYQIFKKEVPFVLLPDAIRAYVGPRQAGHFERKPDGTDVSWMKYPNASVLKTLTKENVNEKISYYVADGIPKCAIGEETDIGTFDTKNWDNPHFAFLRIHLVQDYILDAVLREELIDHTNRFEDEFIVRHNRTRKMNGAELRAQVAKFEELGFIKLVGAVYEKTGILMNREWFDTYVLEALKEAYPEDLAANTYKYMGISDEVNNRINAYEFDLTEEERDSVYMADNLDDVLDFMYSRAYLATMDQL